MAAPRFENGPAKIEPVRRSGGRATLAPALLLLAALFAVVFALMAQTVISQREARARFMRHNTSVVALSGLMEALLDAETGQRGFLLTGKAAYLKPYAASRQRLSAIAPELDRIARDSKNPAAAGHVAQIRKLIDAKFDELDETVGRFRAGDRAGAMALVDSDLGKRDMDLLRGELDWMRRDESAQLQTEFQRAESLGRRLLPLIALLGAGMAVLLAVALRSTRALARSQAEAEQAAALRSANERNQLLARELNHRVKNLFSVVLSIVTISGRKVAPAPEVVNDIRARIHALSLAHATSQGAVVEHSPQLGEVIRATLRPYADEAGVRILIEGPELELPVRMVTPMGLLIHELATNASKYGALSVPGGRVRVAWELEPGEGGAQILRLVWKESDGPPLTPDTGVPVCSGFGSRLVSLAAQQMGGTIDRAMPVTGAVLTLTCPLPADGTND